MKKRIFVIYIFFIFFIFFISNTASAANLIQNGDFETGDFTNWTNNNYHVSSSDAYAGSYSALKDIYVNSGGSGNTEDTTYFYQSIDLTSVDCISFYYKHDINGIGGTFLSSQIYCDIDRDNSYEWIVTSDVESYTYVEVNTSEITGVHDVEFGSYFAFTDAEFYIYNRFDDIVADGIQPTVNINTRVTHADTPLTSVVIDDENNTGGFPNENGERYLTPNEKDSKEYIVYLSGGDLQDGFKLTISANSTEVTKLTIDINDLAASRIYNIYLDDTRVDTISSTTTHQYGITSFSVHTLEVKDVTPPPDTMPAPFPLCSGVVCSPHCEGTTYYYNGRCIDGACVYDSQANHDNCVGESEYEEYDDEDKKLSGEHYTIGRFGITIPDLSESPFLEVILFMFISFIVVSYAAEKR